jgi:hypothetical protein
MGHVHATPYLTVWVVFGPLFAAAAAFICGWVYLSGALSYVRTTKPYLADALPDQGSSRGAAIGFLLWIWTSMHRQLEDRGITQTIYFVRSALVATILMFILLYALPRDFAEQLSDYLNGRGF